MRALSHRCVVVKLRIERDDSATTFCDEAHPVRLGRNPQHLPHECHERDEAIRHSKKGYRCPGNEEHSYSVWVLYDADDPNEQQYGTFDTYREAVRAREHELQLSEKQS